MRSGCGVRMLGSVRSRRFVGRSMAVGMSVAVWLAMAGAPASAAEVEVSVVDFDFTPASLSVVAGDTVVFVNTGSATHQIVASDSSFDSGSFGPDERFSVIVADAPIAYSCARHVNMTGTIAIELTGGSATITSAPPTSAPTVTAAATTAPELAVTGGEDATLGAVGAIAVAFGVAALTALRRRRPRVGATFDGEAMLPSRDLDRRSRVRRPPAEF